MSSKIKQGKLIVFSAPSGSGKTTIVRHLLTKQELQPSKKHLPVKQFITPDQFKEYETIGLELGFRHVESSALVRSSYKAQKHIN